MKNGHFSKAAVFGIRVKTCKRVEVLCPIVYGKLTVLITGIR